VAVAAVCDRSNLLVFLYPHPANSWKPFKFNHGFPSLDRNCLCWVNNVEELYKYEIGIYHWWGSLCFQGLSWTTIECVTSPCWLVARLVSGQSMLTMTVSCLDSGMHVRQSLVNADDHCVMSWLWYVRLSLVNADDDSVMSWLWYVRLSLVNARHDSVMSTLVCPTVSNSL